MEAVATDSCKNAVHIDCYSNRIVNDLLIPLAVSHSKYIDKLARFDVPFFNYNEPASDKVDAPHTANTQQNIGVLEQRCVRICETTTKLIARNKWSQ